MRCKTARQLLHLHREGERSAWQERRLARHLRNCPSCCESAAQSMSEYESLRHALRSAPIEAIGENGVVHAVLARIAQQEKNGARERPRFGTAASAVPRYAAAMMLVLIVGGFLLQFITVHNKLETLGRTLTDTAMPVVTMHIGYEIRTTQAELASLDSLCLPSATAMMFAQRGQISREEAESLLRFAAMHPRCRRQLEAVILDRVSSGVDITPMLTLRIQHQGA
jgi:predicted anti-sigma-YlaC factor YlaD